MLAFAAVSVKALCTVLLITPLVKVVTVLVCKDVLTLAMQTQAETQT